jgi:hypothetical protein
VRPKSIVYFERLQFSSLAIGITYALYALLTEGTRDWSGSVVFIFLFIVALIGGLTLLVSRCRSKVAMWVMIAMFIIGAPSTVRNIVSSGAVLESIEMAVQSIIQAVGLVLLFTPTARRWMSRRADPVKAEIEIFS